MAAILSNASVGGTWQPSVALVQAGRRLRLGASELESASDARNCALRTAWTMRPDTYPDTGTWRPRKGPFLLAPLAAAVPMVHHQQARGLGLWDAVDMALRQLQVSHEGVAAYLKLAITNYFEFHEAREEEVGPLRFLGTRPEINPTRDSNLFTWGFAYETQAGDREMRRVRFGTARSAVTPWADLSAYILSNWPTATAGQVWVTEVGLLDGCENHVVKGVSHETARQTYDADIKPKLAAAMAGSSATPGVGCKECPILPICPALIKMDGFLGQETRGPWTRSVSVSDLEIYEGCPSRWYMERSAHLPADDITSTPLTLGADVHKLLHELHSRGVPCADGDLAASAAATQFDAEAVKPFFLAHIPVCPFQHPVKTRSIEQTIYGYDSHADTVITIKPDLIYEHNSRLVVRETKTTHEEVPDDADLVFDRYFSTSWYIVAAESLLAHYGTTSGLVELEIITRQNAKLFTYDLRDVAVMKMAHGRIARVAREWLADDNWEPRPGARCSWCPVKRWCSAREVN